MTEVSSEELAAMTPKEFRELVRKGEWAKETAYACRQYSQNNLAIVQEKYAFEFLLFCQHNPKPCPIADVTEPGSPCPKLVAPTADLRTDLPRYRVFIDGEIVDEPTDIIKYWRNDLVSFLIGCSHTFEWALRAANIDFWRMGAYISNIPCIPAGRFSGPMVVSCRAFRNSHDAIHAIQISSRYFKSHGPPIHIGDPAVLGIKDITKPEFPDYPRPVEPGEVLLWWGCGVTPQVTARMAKLPILITHKESHMFVNDLPAEEATNL